MTSTMKTTGSTLLQGYDVRRQMLQAHMTVDGLDSLIEDAHRDMDTCEDSGEREGLRYVIQWAREGKRRMAT